MKATVCSLVLLLPLLLAGPVAAEPSISGAETLGAICSTGSLDPVPTAGPCYAKEYCDAGGYVECWGNYSTSTCTAGPEYVECDGQRTECPCQASLTCYGGNVISCTGGGYFNECEVGSNYVNCNEQVTYCPVTCSAQCQGGWPKCNGYNGDTCFTKYGVYPETFYIRCDGQQYDCTGGIE